MILPLLFAATASAIHTPFKYWCGKRYNASAPSFDVYDIGWEDNFDRPHGSEFHRIKVVQNELPYLESDKNGQLAVFIPESVFYNAHNANITVTVPQLGCESVVTPEEAGKPHLIEFDLGEAPKYDMESPPRDRQIKAEFSTGESVMFDFYKLSEPEKGNTIKYHANNNGLSVNSGVPFMPIGYYISNNEVFGGTEEQADKAFEKYAAEGYNVFMLSGFVDNSTQMEWTLKYAEKHGLYFQANIVELCTNITALEEWISEYATHPAFLSYYIADEPDGKQGIGSFEPSQGLRAYQYLKMRDPYHPVTLVTNCAHSAGLYSHNVDFLMTDVYSVGITDTHLGLACNETQGDCGCDLCDVNNPIKAVADRYDYVWADMGVYTGCTFVEQTFHDNTTYWSRSPTYEEEFAMAWISVVSGSNGVLGYTWPVEEKELSRALSDVAAEFSKIGKQITLSGPRSDYGSELGVYYASWGTGAMIAVNTNYEKQTFSVPISGKVEARALGSSKTSKLQGDVLVDTLGPLQVKLYTPLD